MRHFNRSPLCLWIVAVVFTAASPCLAQTLGPDFNDDGYADLPVGVPFEDIGSVQTAGAVNLIYGSAGGLNSAGNQFWHQNRGGVLDAAEAQDQFGHSLAWADFDGDGYDDLAIGSPFEKIGPDTGAGAVGVLYGSPSGLAPAGNQFWHQDSLGITDAAERDDHFGWSVTAGDFNNDGYGDLVIGVPGEDISIRRSCGAIHVLYGSASGLRAAGSRFLHQNSTGMAGVIGNDDEFGWALDTGDFDDDGFDDLAIGVCQEVLDAPGGAAHVLYGSPIGLRTSGSQFFSNADLPVGATGGNFGWSVSAGDFDGNGSDDLAVGKPFAAVSAIEPGAVGVLYGTPGSGLSSAGSQLWHQDSTDVEGDPEDSNIFGWCVAAGDFDGDGYAELAIGEPLDSINGILCGSVHVLKGSAGGLTASGSQYWHQNVAAVPGTNAEADLFGWTLALGDFNGDLMTDLVIGVSAEDVGGVQDAGAVVVLPGSGSGLNASASQQWHQDSPGIVDFAEANENFSFGSMY